MFEALGELVAEERIPGVDGAEAAEKNVVKALGKGLLKTISKMGISTIQSYCGAQIFEAVGLEKTVIDRHFTGTASRIGGIGMGTIAGRGAGSPRARLRAEAVQRSARTCCRSAASTPGAATASTTCGTPRRSR